VDGILSIAEKEELERLREMFTKEFWWITMVVGNSQSYLRIHISVLNGKVSINIRYYL
jgi:hypothetical protein